MATRPRLLFLLTDANLTASYLKRNEVIHVDSPF